jgi:hypothetical protein
MKLNTQKNVILGLMVLSLVVLPTVGFAKEKENKGDKGQKEQKSTTTKNVNKGCLRAYGHLIAPGWLKKNGPVTLPPNCWMPFGIAKKFSGNNSTTTPPVVDTTPPVIRNIVTSTSTSTISLGWNTDELTTTKVYYSTTLPVNLAATSTPFVVNNTLVLNHAISIPNLATSTTYYLVIESRDLANNITTSQTFSLITP